MKKDDTREVVYQEKQDRMIYNREDEIRKLEKEKKELEEKNK